MISTYAGYRPLLAGRGDSSADLSRRHAVLDGDVISVVGGKLTTYRRMAEDVVDLLTDWPCRTKRLPLVGAQPWRGGVDRLTARFGSESELVRDCAGPAGALPVGDTPVLGCELTWAIAAEGAITEADILERRATGPHAGLAAAGGAGPGSGSVRGGLIRPKPARQPGGAYGPLPGT